MWLRLNRPKSFVFQRESFGGGAVRSMIFVLLSILSFDVSAGCDGDRIRELAGKFIQDVAPSMGIPIASRMEEIKDLFSDSFAKAINETKTIEDLATKLILRAGEDAWPLQEYIFVGGADGFKGHKITSIDSKKIAFEMKGESLDGTPISWSISLNFVEESDRCVIDNVVFENGLSTKGILEKQKIQYQKVIEIYKDMGVRT